MRTINENTKTFKAEGKIFIIPVAGMMPINLSINSEARIAIAKQVCELNGMVFDEYQDIMLETWFYVPEWETDNLPDHGGYITVSEAEQFAIGVDTCRWLPAKLFAGKREGDTVAIKIPGWFRRIVDGVKAGSGDAVIDLTLTLDQTHHRYKHCGTWEQVMCKAVAAAN